MTDHVIAREGHEGLESLRDAVQHHCLADRWGYRR